MRAARAAGVPIFAVPGPSALLAALAIAGLPTRQLSLPGLPRGGGEPGTKALQALLGPGPKPRRLYESPRRLAATLAALAEVFGGNREAAVALELTKRFERLARGSLAELAAQYEGQETKGEAVILVAGAEAATADAADWQAALADALEDQPLRAAVDAITERFGLKRKDV